MDLTKFEDWFNPIEIDTVINVIGTGAVGSWLAEGLVRMGFSNIILYDFDEVSPHNLTNQNFLSREVGHEKVKLVARRLKLINPDVKISVRGKYKFDPEKKNYLTGYVFLCVDKIETRKEIVESNPFVQFWSDVRLGLEEGQVYSARQHTRQQLLETMQWTEDDPDVDVVVSACGRELGILPTVWIAVSQAINNFVLFLKDNVNYRLIVSDSLQMKSIAFEEQDK